MLWLCSGKIFRLRKETHPQSFHFLNLWLVVILLNSNTDTLDIFNFLYYRLRVVFFGEIGSFYALPSPTDTHQIIPKKNGRGVAVVWQRSHRVTECSVRLYPVRLEPQGRAPLLSFFSFEEFYTERA